MSYTSFFRLGLTLLAAQPLVGCLSTTPPASADAPKPVLAAASKPALPAPAPVATSILPLVLHLNDDATPDLPDLTQRLQQVAAGNPSADPVTVQNLRVISPGWYGFSFVCNRRIACEQARSRLAAQTDWVAELQNDGRRSRPAPIAPLTPSAR
ncbi:MAG: hypothetical protein AB3X44_20375 [Leptothrix sp. (in: b-proteobacteria)]